MSDPGLEIVDDDGERLQLDGAEADALFAMTGELDDATVSACPGCRSRILTVVALVELLDASPPSERGEELVELADEAPTLHLYVRDRRGTCHHRAWRDPGFDEWAEVFSSRTTFRR